MNQLADSHYSNSAQVAREISQVRQELRDMRETLNSLKGKSGGYQKRRSILFRPRLSQKPAPVEPEKPKPALSLEDLLPLLPQLSNAFPQLKNPKVADSLKILSNPAVLSVIQQFLSNGGLQGIKTRQVRATRRDRRYFP